MTRGKLIVLQCTQCGRSTKQDEALEGQVFCTRTKDALRHKPAPMRRVK